MPRKITLGALKKNYSPPVEEIQEELIQVNKNKIEENKNRIIKYLEDKYEDKIFFSIEETAELTNLSYDFIRKKILTGKVHAVKFGDLYKVNIFELKRIITEGI